jgi:hypothetical protein
VARFDDRSTWQHNAGYRMALIGRYMDINHDGVFNSQVVAVRARRSS